MINRILRLFNLITISQAKRINQETAAGLHRWMAIRVEENFGALPRAGSEDRNREWANECFDLMIDNQNPSTVTLMHEIEFVAMEGDLQK